MSTSPFNIPSTFGRADGTLGNPGTPEAPDSILMNYAGGITLGGGGYIPVFEEMPDSPTIEVAEQTTIVHRYHCDYYTAQLIIITTPRGTLFTDDSGPNPPYLSRVLSVTMQSIPRTGMRECSLTIVAESITLPPPQDEFSIEPIDLNPALEKHPRYSALTYNDRWIVKQAESVDSQDFAQEYINRISVLSSSAIQSQNEHDQALELLYKKHKGEDSFYLSGYRITYSQYFYYPQIVNPGGYIEDPVQDGGLPIAYWSTTGDSNGINIFSQTTTHNGNLFPPNQTWPGPTPLNGLSWIRRTDKVDLQRTWFKLTKIWEGGPIGVWDNELYNPIQQPLNTNPNAGGFAL